MKIYDLRTDGKKKSPMGQSYGVKTANMAVRVAEVLCGGYVDPTLVKATGYKSQDLIYKSLLSLSQIDLSIPCP